MMRLVFADLRDHAVTWVGAFAVAVVCGYLGGWSASMVATAQTYPNLQDMAWIVVAFSSIAALAVLSQTANLTVSVQRRSYALWQLANVSPHQVSIAVLMQLVAVAFLGALCGTLLEAVTFVPLFPFVFSSPFYAPPENVALDVGVRLMPAVWLAVAGLFCLGGLRSARNAGKTPPLVALREDEPKRKGITMLRALMAVGLVVGTGAFAAFLVSSEAVVAFQNALYLPLLMVATLVPCASLVLSAVLRAWTCAVPQKRWNAWYLARHAARFGLFESTAVETPLMVGFGLVAGIFSLSGMGSAYVQLHALDMNTTLDWTSTVLLLGGPVLLCATGAAISVLMSARTRARDVALLVVAGARPSTLVAAAVLEAGIHAVTATLVGGVAVVASSLLVAYACQVPLFAGISFTEGLVVTLVGFALTCIALLIPTCAALFSKII